MLVLRSYTFFYATRILSTHNYLTSGVIILANIFLAISELCTILVTISLTNLIAPERYKSTLMGSFYFSLVFSGYFLGIVAQLVNSHHRGLADISISYLHLTEILFLLLILLLLIQQGIKIFKYKYNKKGFES